MRSIQLAKQLHNIYDFRLFQQNQHIGSCKLMINDNKAIVNHIYIDDLHKGKGHGSWLLQETEKILKHEHNVDSISLLGWQPSGSFEIVDFYKKNGYVTTYEHCGIYDDHVTLFDLHQLHKKI